MKDIYQLVQSDFDQFDTAIQMRLNTSIELIQRIYKHIVQGGGKRIRPLLTILAARALHCQNTQPISLAIIIEFLHTATLLHDDVIDGSTLRRGRKTANILWGNAASILVGDFLYSRAFQLMKDLKNLTIYSLLADATHLISQGEVLQLESRHRLDLSETEYLDIIRYKTATLFSAATECGAVIADANTLQQKALAEYGLHVGIAFQLIDDWLDYTMVAGISGKNPGNDLIEGKVTLPLIHAMQHGTPEQATYIRMCLKTGNVNHLTEILAILKIVNTEPYLVEMVKKETHFAKTALIPLPDTIYKNALLQLADLAINRFY